MTDTSKLTHLGSDTVYSYSAPDKNLLEVFDNPFSLRLYPKERCRDGASMTGCAPIVRISAPEFTSLCPKTGQPDFAEIVVEYTPFRYCVESKSFKLYLGSFRMHGEFHEACVNRIINDLIDLMDPLWISVEGRFTPRGGIPFHPRAEWHRE